MNSFYNEEHNIVYQSEESEKDFKNFHNIQIISSVKSRIHDNN